MSKLLVFRNVTSSLICLSITFVLFVSNSCYGQEKLYTKLISISGPKDSEKRDSTFATVDHDTFEMALHSINQGEKYRAQRTIERPKIGQEFRMVTLFLADAEGNHINFDSADQFIKYMDARGYKVASETKRRYSTDYVFTRN